VRPEQLHLTLRFIGDADEGLFATIRDGLGGIRAPSFPIALKGVGCFPSPRRPRVVWVGTEAGDPLFHLQREVERIVSEAGVAPDEKRFSPHITLARLREASPSDFGVFQARHAGFRTEPFAVEAFHLYSSTLTPKGAIHRREASYPLTVS
jgi:2'-5' RNA ligase